MSVVTTVIVVCSYDPHDETIKAISEFTGNSQGIPLQFGKPIDHCGPHVGGYKCAETDVVIGAWNHFDTEGFLKHLETVPWASPEDSCVVIQSSDLEFVKVFQPERRKR